MDRLRARRLSVDSVRLIVVESIDTRTSGTEKGCCVYANLTPFAVVACGPTGTSVFDMRASPFSIADLERVFPEISELIDVSVDN